jgi:ParB family chromosome partitioning protein
MKQLRNSLSSYFNPDHKDTAMTTANTPVAALAAAVAATVPAAKTPTVHSTLPSGITKKTTRYNADPRRITFRADWNNRFDMGDIRALADGIRTTLERDPARPFASDMDVKRIPAGDPRAKKHDFEVVAGHRRLLATQMLMKDGVLFPEGVNINLVAANQSDLDSTIMLFNENNQKPLLPLEEAAAFKRLRDFNMTILQIAKAVGKSDVHVTDTLALLEADQEVQDAIKDGSVGATMGKAIAATARGDKELQKDMLKDAKAAKGKDASAKAAKARLLKKLEAKKQAKAAAKGKVLKLKPIDAVDLSDLGLKMAHLLEAKAKEAKWAYDGKDWAALFELVKKDEGMAAAFTLGALAACHVVAGTKGIDLDI